MRGSLLFPSPLVSAVVGCSWERSRHDLLSCFSWQRRSCTDSSCDIRFACHIDLLCMYIRSALFAAQTINCGQISREVHSTSSYSERRSAACARFLQNNADALERYRKLTSMLSYVSVSSTMPCDHGPGPSDPPGVYFVSCTRECSLSHAMDNLRHVMLSMMKHLWEAKSRLESKVGDFRSMYVRFVHSGDKRSFGSDRCDDADSSPSSFPRQTQEIGLSGSITW